MKKFWNWARDETAPDARVLRLEGTIAEESWFEDDVTPAAFKSELFSDTGPVTIWINSPGGDCVAAAQIYNMLIRNAARYLTGEAKAGSIMTTSNDNRRTYNQQSTISFAGSNFYIRDEQDAYALAVEIASLTRRQQRGRGLRMA